MDTSQTLTMILSAGRIARRVEDLDAATLHAIAESAVSPEFAALDTVVEDWNA